MYARTEPNSNSKTLAVGLLALSAGACLGVAVGFVGGQSLQLNTANLPSLTTPKTSSVFRTIPVHFGSTPGAYRVQQAEHVLSADQISSPFEVVAPSSSTSGLKAVTFSVLSCVTGLVVSLLYNRKPRPVVFSTLAASAEVSAPWSPPSLADALKDEKARKKAEAMSTQLPTFWQVRDDLAKVPKSKFGEVFAGYKGSTGTLLNAARTEEYYVITWTSPKKQIYELPTGGAAEMDEGLNIMYFARKEQCLALGTQLRTKFKPRIDNYAVHRVFPNGESQFLHPKDGVFPEKVNQGRLKANHNDRSIGQNVEPAKVKFAGTTPKDVGTQGVAMMASTSEKPAKAPWTVPNLADAMQNTAAVEKAKAMSTQLPTFWEVRDDLAKVPKSKFKDVFAGYQGSTGTLLSAAATEEKYVITWTSPKKQIYELPTGGAAEMDEGQNVMFFARKEQCLALGSQLRTAFKPRIDDFQIYRMFPNGEVQYLHPKDGVFPEKVNEGRQKANHNDRSIGENVEPATVKFAGTTPKDL